VWIELGAFDLGILAMCVMCVPGRRSTVELRPVARRAVIGDQISALQPLCCEYSFGHDKTFSKP
jgi:hypothetical protein